MKQVTPFVLGFTPPPPAGFSQVELPEPWTSFKGVGSVVCYLNNELGHLRDDLTEPIWKGFVCWARQLERKTTGDVCWWKGHVSSCKNGVILVLDRRWFIHVIPKKMASTQFAERKLLFELFPDTSKLFSEHLLLPPCCCSILMFPDFQSPHGLILCNNPAVEMCMSRHRGPMKPHGSILSMTTSLGVWWGENRNDNLSSLEVLTGHHFVHCICWW